MARTPKPVRREHKRERSADFWLRKLRTPQPMPRTAPGEAVVLADRVPYVPYTYYPTKTSNPADPRTAAAGYDEVTHTLHVAWGDNGVSYNYYDVPPNIWKNFQRAPSPGKYINRVLNSYRYGPAE